MTQEEHMQMMKDMDSQSGNYKEGTSEDKDMGMKMKEGKKSNMTGTHHIKVVVNDAQSGEVRNGLDAKVEITSPSKKSAWIDLKNMSDHYGSDLSLKEKGLYTFLIKMDDKGVPKMTHFNYTVQ